MTEFDTRPNMADPDLEGGYLIGQILSLLRHNYYNLGNSDIIVEPQLIYFNTTTLKVIRVETAQKVNSLIAQQMIISIKRNLRQVTLDLLSIDIFQVAATSVCDVLYECKPSYGIDFTKRRNAHTHAAEEASLSIDHQIQAQYIRKYRKAIDEKKAALARADQRRELNYLAQK